MNEEICSITKKKNSQEWMRKWRRWLSSSFVQHMYKRLFFHTLVANLFKQRYITDQFSCKLQIFEQVNKWQIKTVLDF